VPHADANQSPWARVTWGTDRSARWDCHIKSGPSIADTILWAGLKLTSTDVVATDADQVFFRYQNGVNDGEWQAVNSIGDSDDAHDTNVAVAANTAYHLVIEIDGSRVARFYINNTLVETSAALTNEIDLVPFIGVKADGDAAAKYVYLRGQGISRTFA